MFIEPPKRLNIKKYETSKQIETENLWEVMVDKYNSFEWSVILSCFKLRDFEVRNFQCFVNSLKKLRFLKQYVKKYNPFLNPRACFCQESIKDVVSELKEALEKKLSQNISTDNKIKAICNMLDIDVILLIENENKIVERRKYFMSSPENSLPSLYLKVQNYNKENESFSFVIQDGECLVMQKKALDCFLKRSGINNSNRNKILKGIKSRREVDSFVIFLLNSNLNIAIPEIFKYPYIINKISSAGFQVDPRVLDFNDCSAFYHAFNCKEKKYLYILYIYAANNCHHSRATYRYPDPNIVANLLDLQNIIEKDSLNSQNREFYLVSRGLLQCNKFFISICQKLLTLKLDLNFSDEIPESEFSDNKLFKTILLILDVYINHFCINSQESNTLDTFSLKIDNFMENKYMYKILDFSAAILLFDNISKVKKLYTKPSPDIYGFKIEIDFFFLLMSYKYNPLNIATLNTKFSKHYPSLSLSKYMENTLITLERINFLDCVKNAKNEFYADFQDTLNKPTQKIKRKSEYLQIIKREFMLSRLKYYTDIALKTKDDTKYFVFVIQKALHILGESLNFEKNNSDFFYDMMIKHIPEETALILYEMRNALTHSKCKEFYNKIHFEKYITLFVNIQNDIKTLVECFEEVFLIHAKELHKFLLERWMSFLKQVRNTDEMELKSITELENYLSDKHEELNNLTFDLSDSERKNNNLPRCENIKILLQILKNDFDLKPISENHISQSYYLGNSDNSSSVYSLKTLYFPSTNSLEPLSLELSTYEYNSALNLYNRIQNLEVLLLEDDDCHEIWKKSKIRVHLVTKIADRYLHEQEFQAAIEMLLFDCLSIMMESPYHREKPLKCNHRLSKSFYEGLHSIVLKTRHLFSGINLRNVLAHGSYIFELISNILDRDDYPSELARKCLEFMDDKDAIGAMGYLWQNVHCDDQRFLDIVRKRVLADRTKEQKELQLIIRKCERWYDYYLLLLKNTNPSTEKN